MHRAIFASVGFIALLVASPARADGRVVAIIGEDYQPFDVTVSAGDTVTWVNEGGAAHNVRSVDGLFSSPTLNNGLSYSFTFSQPGTFDYRCGIHPFMTGTVRVSGGAATATVPVVPTATAVPPTFTPQPIVAAPTAIPTRPSPPPPTATSPATAPIATATPTPGATSTPTTAIEAVTAPASVTPVIAGTPLAPSTGESLDATTDSGNRTTTILAVTGVAVAALAGAWWLARGWWH